MLQLSDALVGLVRDWRATLPPPSLQGPRGQDERLWVAPARGVAHCAALIMSFMSSGRSFEASATRLGEVLRVAELAASRHADPAVWNALWHEDALCPKAPSEECKRCDAVELVAPVVIDLDVRGNREQWTGEALLYEALFEWDECATSDPFKALVRALRAPEDRPTPSCPRVRLHVRVLGALWSPDLPAVSRDLKRLLDRARATQEDAAIELAGMSVCLPSYEAVKPAGREILATVFDSGRPVAFRDYDTFNYQPEMWAPLLAAKSPCLSLMSVKNFQDFDGWVVRLLGLITQPHPHLRELYFLWHLASARAADDYRKHAAEAIGTALFSTDSALRLKHLSINLGELTEEDMDAMENGAGAVNTPHASMRFETVNWCTQETSDEQVIRVVRLLGGVGVRQLSIDTWKRPMSCRTLRAILHHCHQSTKMAVLGLSGDDFSALSEDEWSGDAGRVCDLELRFSGSDYTAQAVATLLRRMGAQLVRLSIATAATDNAAPGRDDTNVFGVETAQAIVQHCPKLEDLEVSGANPRFYEILMDAFDDHDWRLKALTVRMARGDEIGPVEGVARALQDPRRCGARRLRTLRMTTCFHPEFDSLLESLANHSELQRVELLGRLDMDVIAKLRALPRQHLIRAPSVRRQLAFLSVVMRLSRLDRGVMRIIFEFAGRRAGRYALTSP